MIRVLIAEDHGLLRAGLEKLLSAHADVEVVGTAADGGEAVELAMSTHPDVVLMDLSMPVLDGTEATARIVAADPDVAVVILTSFSDRERIRQALDAGAVGYLLKDAEPDELLRGVRAAARGESPLAPKVARAVLSDRAGSKSEPELTARERQVLGFVADGLANKQIARRLGIAEKTVKSHLTNVFQQIGVNDRTQAALWAKEHLHPDGS
jgi:DNA-binding NarL/FixJ family response regulator